MDRNESWLDGELDEELESLDMDANLPEAEKVLEPLDLFERSLGTVNEEEQRYFVLWAVYTTAQESATENGDMAEAMFCNIRAGMIRDIFYFRIAERLKVWDVGVIELGIRQGWKIIGLTAKDKREADTAGNFFPGGKGDGRVM